MSDGAQSVKSARRTLELLEFVASHPDGITFVDLEQALPYPKSSLHGLLQTIVSMRWLTFDADDRRYTIGVRPWEVGQVFRSSHDVAVHARRFLREANAQLQETIQLGILDDLDVVYVDKVEGTRPLRLVSNVGSRLPAYVTGIGKALLSGLPDSVLNERFGGVELEQYTDHTIASGDALIDVIRHVRETGYATDSGEYSTGVYCVAVPVLDAGGTVVAAVSCSVPQARVDAGDVDSQTMVETLVACSAGITRALSAVEPE